MPRRSASQHASSREGSSACFNRRSGLILVHSREVFRLAIVTAANAIVLMHNHPSGESAPSEADIRVTRDLIRAGQLLKIQVLRPCNRRKRESFLSPHTRVLCALTKINLGEQEAIFTKERNRSRYLNEASLRNLPVFFEAFGLLCALFDRLGKPEIVVKGGHDLFETNEQYCELPRSFVS